MTISSHTRNYNHHFDVSLNLQCNIKEGGLVPKTLYRSLEFSEGEESWSSEIYQTTHVSKGSPHEVCHAEVCVYILD